MKNSLLALATVAVCAALPAQNTNETSPTAGHKLVYTSGAKIAVNYCAFTIATGSTLRGLTSGNSRSATFYNDIYIPMMLNGHLELNAAATLGDQKLAAGKYRFAFHVGGKDAWIFDVYSDTGKKTIGDDKWSPKSGWWKQEKKVAQIALKIADSGDDSASRLSIVPVAAVPGGKGNGDLLIRFGPYGGKIAFSLGSPMKSVEASGKRKK